MKKIVLMFAMMALCGILSLSLSTPVFAEGSTPNYVSVTILSPTDVTAYPGYETTVRASVRNNTDQVLNDLVVYITMVDLTKNMTVNLEDYNASVPVVIPELPANSETIVELPIILVYPDTFHLYVSVANLDTNTIISSDSIVTAIQSQVSIDPNLVILVSISTPILILLSAIGVSLFRRKRIAVHNE